MRFGIWARGGWMAACWYGDKSSLLEGVSKGARVWDFEPVDGTCELYNCLYCNSFMQFLLSIILIFNNIYFFFFIGIMTWISIILITGLQVLVPYSDGLCLHLLDMLSAAKGIWHNCINAVTISCIRKTPSRSIYSKNNTMSYQISMVEEEFNFLIIFDLL